MQSESELRKIFSTATLTSLVILVKSAMCDLRAIQPHESAVMVFSHILSLESELRRRFARLLRDDNQRRPINALPDELFLDVVGLLRTSDLVRASHVCTLWRDSIINCPSLWADVDLQDVSWPLDAVSEILARSADQRGLSCATLNGVKHLSLLSSTKNPNVHLIDLPAPRLRSLKMQASEFLWTSTSIFQGIAPNLQHISMRSVYIRKQVINLPSVRFWEFPLHVTSRTTQQLKNIALLCPNLQLLHLCEKEHPFSDLPFIVKQAGSLFQTLMISADTLLFAPTQRQYLRISLSLIPQIIIRSHSSLVTRFILDVFPVVVQLYIDKFGAQGRTEDGRVFWWTFPFVKTLGYDGKPKAPICFEAPEVGIYLHQAFSSIDSLHLRFSVVHGRADDGRTFTWSGAPLPADNSFISRNWLSTLRTLHVDIDRLFILASTMPLLESLTVEILPQASQHVLRHIFGMHPEHESVWWPTVSLQALKISFSSQTKDNSEEVIRSIRVQQLAYFVHDFLCISTGQLSALALQSLVIADLQSGVELSHLASSVLLDERQAGSAGEQLPLPLVRHEDLSTETSAGLLDVTNFYRLCRVTDMEDVSLVKDLDWYHSDGSTYDPDEDETDFGSEDVSANGSDEGDSEDIGDEESAIGLSRSDDHEPDFDSDADSDRWSVDSEEIAREAQDLLAEFEELLAFTGDFERLGNKGRTKIEGALDEGELPFIPTFVGRRFVEILEDDA